MPCRAEYFSISCPAGRHIFQYHVQYGSLSNWIRGIKSLEVSYFMYLMRKLLKSDFNNFLVSWHFLIYHGRWIWYFTKPLLRKISRSARVAAMHEPVPPFHDDCSNCCVMLLLLSHWFGTGLADESKPLEKQGNQNKPLSNVRNYNKNVLWIKFRNLKGHLVG